MTRQIKGAHEVTNQEMVKEFHEAAELDVNTGRFPPKMDDDASLNLWQFRNDLVYEEAMEFHDAFKGPDPAHILKEMADLLYVLYGTAVSYGWDLDEAFKRVHRSNMSKFPMTKNKDGKVVKGPNYIPPQLQDLVE